MENKMGYCLVFLCIVMFGHSNYGQAQTHFNCVSNTGDSYAIVMEVASINGQDIDTGDEIAVFTPEGVCAGIVVPDSATKIALAAWKDDPQTAETKDGFATGDSMSFKIWDANENLEYFAIATYSTGDGTFENGAFSIISVLEGNIPTDVDEGKDDFIPTKFSLSQNYPNPFNPETTIEYQLLKTSQIKLVIYNLAGQRVATLVNRQQSAGIYSVQWNGKDETGRNVTSGVYIYRIRTKEFDKVKKLSLIR